MTEYSPVNHPVAEMFGSIAPKYDLTNSILSFGTHHFWKRALIKKVPIVPIDSALDLCSGTGDLLPLLKMRCARVVGADFCQPMLDVAEKRFNSDQKQFELVQADAMNLPFADESFDLITVSFGVRNFKDLSKGLSEINRVLKTGGTLLILEFGQPKGLFGPIFRIYSDYIMPVIGGLITGNRSAYTYLPQTSRNFPCGSEFETHLSNRGFSNISFKPLTFGVSYIYQAQK